MSSTRRDRSVPVLIGLGLVLAGLLAGILVMLVVVDLRPASSPARPVVERVQLGSAEPLRPLQAPDSVAPAVVVGPATLNTLFKEVASRVTPAVVYIQVEFSAGDLPRDWFRSFDEDAQQRLYRDHVRQSVGSGVIISDRGHIVTNQHVVDGATSIQVTLPDKRAFGAEVVGIDPSTDLAVIQVEPPLPGRPPLPVARLGDADRVEVGEWVLAVGNPFRLNSTVTAGIVSALGRQVNIIDDQFGIEHFIQTDAAINPGNSGGALVNLQGELIGINTAIATESGSYEGYGFAVPVNLVERIAEDLITYGEVQRGFLGVEIAEVTARTARRLGLDRVAGVRLTKVTPDGPADRGGLRGGDVVLSIDGRAVDAPNELQSVVALRRPGETLAVEVVRAGARRRFSVELMGRDDPGYESWLSRLRQGALEPERVPAPEVEAREVEGWGLGLHDLSSRERAGFDVESGAYLAYVESGSAADAAGLPRDVVITHVDDEPVTSAEEVAAALGAAEAPVLFRVQGRDGIGAFYEVDPGVPIAE